MPSPRVQRELTLSFFNTNLGELYAQLFACQERKQTRLLTVANINHFVDRLDTLVTGCVQQGRWIDAINGYMDAGAQPSRGYTEAKTTEVSVAGRRIRVGRTRARFLKKPDDFKLVLGITIADPALKKQLKAAGWIADGSHWYPKEASQ